MTGKLKRLAQATLGILIAMSLVSMLFPSTFGCERSLLIRAPASVIYPWLLEPGQWKRWFPWFEDDPTTKLRYAGPARGPGAQVTWESSARGGGAVQIVSVEEFKRVEYSIVFSSGTPATGRFELLAQANGDTKLVWRLEGKTGWNPIARWFGLLSDKMFGPTHSKGLENLAKLSESSKR